MQPTSTGGGVVTLVEGSSFCICTSGGDLTGAGPHGMFFRDTRFLSLGGLRVDGAHSHRPGIGRSADTGRSAAPGVMGACPGSGAGRQADEEAS